MIDKNITNPGHHKQFLMNRFNDEEQRILRGLEKSWYLTNSGESVYAAQSKYDYFLMKPTPRTSEMFNIEREIICVFSDYSNFESRSLDIFDKVISRLPKMRTESVCEILISRAPQVEEKVDKMLKSDPEHPIVIPFTYEELLHGDVGSTVENRFRKHFYTRDLFSFLSPLKKDTYFFGRSNLINEIVNRFHSGEHTSLFGLRKSGKTSIVYAIERRLESTGDSVLSIDCESPSIHLLRWYELLEKVVNMYQQVRDSKVKVVTRDRYEEKMAADSFEADMLRIHASKKAASTLFIFDEIERLTPGTASSLHWKDGSDFIYFWQTLRGFYQRHPEVFSYMVVGTNPSCIESPMLAGHENPIYASIPSQYVPPFTVEQVGQMVSRLGDYMGLRFDSMLYSKLTEDFGGHPFLIRQMCSAVNQQASQIRPVTIDKALYQKAKVEFQLGSLEYLEMMVYVLSEWYPDEYEMLRYLAQGDMESFESFARDHPSYTRHLIGYGLIQKGAGGYSFNLESLADVLRAKHAMERLNLTAEEKLAEVSGRRIAIEKKLRTSIKNSLHANFGAADGAARVIASVPDNRKEKLKSLNLQELLDKDKSPLFFLELVGVIRREWEVLKNVLEIDKTKLVVMLEEINEKGRPDAHAKSLSQDDFAQLRLYFSKLEALLIDWG
ncbi:ATP-binding protein [Rhodanobacter sp. IGA1.0]|uniref:ATP-binding protein n=1 Tax=Rhodanobacter sp. IGA1.0 TaxID=3158582 RepID=A0AAU7QGL9_9GAMM